MDIRDRRGLKNAAAQSLENVPNQRRLVLIWAGVVALLSLAVSGLNYILQDQIGQTGGLSGIGMRSLLTTVQNVLTMGFTFLTPFWRMGYLAAVLKISRRETCEDGVLLAGFHHFFPVLRLLLLRGMLMIGLCIGCINLGSLLFSFTPLVSPIYALMEPLMQLSSEAEIVNALLCMDPATLLTAMAPVLIACGVLCAVVCILVAYRLRMADFYMMDTGCRGAMEALRLSNQMMRGNGAALFRLDISFWWFYLAEVLIAMLAWGDVLLAALGVSLPVSGSVLSFLCYFLSIAMQTALYVATYNYVTATYAKAYDSLKTA